jgi:hypothetical protein
MQKALIVCSGSTATLNGMLSDGWEVKNIEPFRPAFGGSSTRSDDGSMLVILERLPISLGDLPELKVMS